MRFVEFLFVFCCVIKKGTLDVFFTCFKTLNILISRYKSVRKGSSHFKEALETKCEWGIFSQNAVSDVTLLNTYFCVFRYLG